MKTTPIIEVEPFTAHVSRFCRVRAASVANDSVSLSVIDTFPNHDLDRLLGVVKSPSAASTIHVHKKMFQPRKKRRPSSHVSSQIIPKPKRPLTAYNFFFRYERARLVGAAPPSESAPNGKRIHRKTHGKIGFVALAKTIGSKWNDLDASSRDIFERQAFEDLKRYREEMSEYNKRLQASDQPMIERIKKAKTCQQREETTEKDALHSSMKINHDSSNGAEKDTKHAAQCLHKTLSMTLDICEDAQKACGKPLFSSGFLRRPKIPTENMLPTPCSSICLRTNNECQLGIDHEPSISGGSIGDLESDLSCVLSEDVIQLLSNINEDDPESLAV